MDYLELRCTVPEPGQVNELLIAYLDTAGFTMFQETPQGLLAYIPKSDFDEENFRMLPIHSDSIFKGIEFELGDTENRNWNAEWEHSFEPVIIDRSVVIRAEHHPPVPEAGFELIITPKMSFGTGHHATTGQMISLMLNIDFPGRRVLDIGTGTAILGIMAEKLGAVHVDCVDNDPNAVANARENIALNGCRKCYITEGNAHTLVGNIYHIILANINRNIILEDLPLYSGYLENGGILLVSGFYREDLDLISKRAAESGFRIEKETEQNDWCCALFIK